MDNEHIVFLPDDNEYDPEETLDLLGCDLVEMFDEINVKQNEVIIDDKEMEKVDDVISEEEYDNDAIIYDDVDNLQKRKRKCRKKFFLQTEINELQNKLHANKYFMEEEITPKLVQDKNLTTHGELSNCKYSGEGQQKKVRYEEENTIVQKGLSLYEEKY
ncbi:hypothetical protein RhiirA1_469310 [Rhizophagus irregularis]|uniref:Uncharacterized protein n=1 Tax=Rhizophagus irregularis TaxID=588596 RepID=A0A2I1E122_9GLOM|nr:hypothetical protein RhiirA1_469310 [Rhizophagus irregularis]PKY15791.1 hypothetical protein RhiirB3_428045 [Rhizophagus irregularis]